MQTRPEHAKKVASLTVPAASTHGAIVLRRTYATKTKLLFEDGHIEEFYHSDVVTSEGDNSLVSSRTRAGTHRASAPARTPRATAISASSSTVIPSTARTREAPALALSTMTSAHSASQTPVRGGSQFGMPSISPHDVAREAACVEASAATHEQDGSPRNPRAARQGAVVRVQSLSGAEVVASSTPDRPGVYLTEVTEALPPSARAGARRPLARLASWRITLADGTVTNAAAASSTSTAQSARVAQHLRDVRDARLAKKAAAGRVLKPHAPSMLSIALPIITADGELRTADHDKEAMSDGTTRAHARPSAAAAASSSSSSSAAAAPTDIAADATRALTRYPDGATPVEVYERVMRRERGAMQARLSGLDIHRFMHQSAEASAVALLFFWFVVLRSRRSFLEHLLEGRYKLLLSAYRELFPRRHTARLPSLGHLERMVDELLMSGERWDMEAPEGNDDGHDADHAHDNRSDKTQHSDTSRMAGAPAEGPHSDSTTTAASTATDAAARQRLQQRRLDTFYRENGYLLLAEQPELLRAGVPPPMDVVWRLITALDAFTASRDEFEEVQTLEERCFHGLAVQFGRLFLSLKQQKDFILESYEHVIAHITYYALLFNFINDAHGHVFNEDFRVDLFRLFHYWCSGLLMTHVPSRQWPVPLPEDVAAAYDAAQQALALKETTLWRSLDDDDNDNNNNTDTLTAHRAGTPTSSRHNSSSSSSTAPTFTPSSAVSPRAASPTCRVPTTGSCLRDIDTAAERGASRRGAGPSRLGVTMHVPKDSTAAGSIMTPASARALLSPGGAAKSWGPREAPRSLASSALSVSGGSPTHTFALTHDVTVTAAGALTPTISGDLDGPDVGLAVEDVDSLRSSQQPEGDVLYEAGAVPLRSAQAGRRTLHRVPSFMSSSACSVSDATPGLGHPVSESCLPTILTTMTTPIAEKSEVPEWPSTGGVGRSRAARANISDPLGAPRPGFRRTAGDEVSTSVSLAHEGSAAPRPPGVRARRQSAQTSRRRGKKPERAVRALQPLPGEEDFDELDIEVANGEYRLISKFARYAQHANHLMDELEKRVQRQHHRQLRKNKLVEKAVEQGRQQQQQQQQSQPSPPPGLRRMAFPALPNAETEDALVNSGPGDHASDGGARSVVAAGPASTTGSPPTRWAFSVPEQLLRPASAGSTASSRLSMSAVSSAGEASTPDLGLHTETSHKRQKSQAGPRDHPRSRRAAARASKSVATARRTSRTGVASNQSTTSTTTLGTAGSAVMGVRRTTAGTSVGSSKLHAEEAFTSALAASHAAHTASTTLEEVEMLNRVELARSRFLLSDQSATTPRVTPRVTPAEDPQAGPPAQRALPGGRSSAPMTKDAAGDVSIATTTAAVTSASLGDPVATSLLTAYPLAVCAPDVRAFLMDNAGLRYTRVPFPLTTSSASAAAVLAEQLHERGPRPSASASSGGGHRESTNSAAPLALQKKLSFGGQLHTSNGAAVRRNWSFRSSGALLGSVYHPISTVLDDATTTTPERGPSESRRDTGFAAIPILDLDTSHTSTTSAADSVAAPDECLAGGLTCATAMVTAAATLVPASGAEGSRTSVASTIGPWMLSTMSLAHSMPTTATTSPAYSPGGRRRRRDPKADLRVHELPRTFIYYMEQQQQQQQQRQASELAAAAASGGGSGGGSVLGLSTLLDGGGVASTHAPKAALPTASPFMLYYADHVLKVDISGEASASPSAHAAVAAVVPRSAAPALKIKPKMKSTPTGTTGTTVPPALAPASLEPVPVTGTAHDGVAIAENAWSPMRLTGPRASTQPPVEPISWLPTLGPARRPSASTAILSPSFSPGQRRLMDAQKAVPLTSTRGAADDRHSTSAAARESRRSAVEVAAQRRRHIAPRATVRLSNITRQEGRTRHLVYQQLQTHVQAQQQQVQQDLEALAMRERVSRHEYQSEHLRSVQAVRDIMSDNATRRYQRRARDALELREKQKADAHAGTQ